MTTAINAASEFAVAVMSLLPFITREYFSPHPQTQKTAVAVVLHDPFYNARIIFSATSNVRNSICGCLA